MSEGDAENGRTGRLAAVLLASWMMALFTGCAGTRFPSFRPSSIQAKQREAELFYPFAEEGTGPSMESQPREYAVPRSEATRLQRTNQYFIP